MTDVVYPEKGDRLLVNPGRRLFLEPFQGQKFIRSGYTFLGDDGGLNFTVSSGFGYANGTLVDRDISTVLAATDSATNYVFVYYKDDLDDNIVYFEVNTSGSPPSGYTATSQKIMEVVASGGSITGDTDARVLSPFAVPLRFGGLTGVADLLSGDVAGRSRIGLSTSEDRILLDGKTGGSTTAQVDLFRETNTSGARAFRVFQGDGTATIRLTFDPDTGQLSLPVTGAGAGLLIGGDTTIYRSGTSILHTDDIFESGVYFHGRSGGGAGAAFRVGNDAEIHDINVSNELAIVGVQTPANGRLAFGSAADTVLFRGTANRLDLASGDNFRIVSGQLQFGTDIALSRGIANRLDLVTGDSLNLVNGGYMIGSLTVINNARDLVGLAAVGQHLDPDIANTYDLGDATRRWRDLYIDDIDVDGSIIMDSGETVDGVDVSELATKSLWIPVDGDFTQGSPTAGSWRDYPKLQLAETVIEGYFGSFAVPEDWDVGTSITFKVVFATIFGGGSGNVRWQLRYRSKNDLEDINSGDITIEVTDTPSGTGSVMGIATFAAQSGSNFADNEIVGFRLVRDATDGADTYDNELNLFGLKVEYTAG